MKTKLRLLNSVLVSMVFITSVISFSGCTQKTDTAINKDFMDLTVNPGDDFYRYANGNWIKNNEIPDDRSSYGSFDIVGKETDKNIQTLLEEVAKKTDAEKGSVTQKIRDFYVTGMDTAKIEVEGIKPLQSELILIESIKSMEDFQNVVARFHTFGLDPLFNGGIEQDLMDSKQYKFYLMQAGLGLPDRDYYTTDDDRSREIRTEYVKHVAKMFELTGVDAEVSAKNAEVVMNIETRLAEKSKTNTEMRNIPALYNKMTLVQLAELAPGFDWTRYFTNILNHQLTIFADNYTPTDPSWIPTGEIAPVEGTDFDFTQSHKVGERIKKLPYGYNMNFVLNKKSNNELSKAAEVYDPESGRFMEVYTTEPGVQLYTADYLDGSIIGSGNIVYGKNMGLCLEAQHFPDSPNKPNFPSTVLRPGETYTQLTIYKMSTR